MIKYLIILILFLASLLYAETDQEILLDIEKRAFNYFWNEASPSTGIVKDQALNNYNEIDGSTVGSIAATGFGLTAVCIAHNRGWITYDQAYQRVINTLIFFKEYVYNKKGFYYHFIDINSGKRYSSCELSSIDTALFIAGVIFAGQYFQGTAAETYSRELYERIEWDWMCGTNSDFVYMAWKPEHDTNNGYRIAYSNGYLSTSQWSGYNEGLLLYTLASGSPLHLPLHSPDGWVNLDRPVTNIYGYSMIYSRGNNSIFMHQYPQCWLDLRQAAYNGFCYYTNSRNATLVNKYYSWNANGYNSNIWGLSACNSPFGGYLAYGSTPGFYVINDGTIAPVGPCGSVMFTPQESIASIKYLINNFSSKLYKKYGFSSSFNLLTSPQYFDEFVIGIDQGSILISIDNYLSGMVWNEFKKISYIKNAIQVMNFTFFGDTEPPSRITRLTISGNVLSWIAPRDNSGTVKAYVIKYLDRPIIKPADWYEAKEIPNQIIPEKNSGQETFTIENIPAGKYYFAVQSLDNSGNLSDFTATDYKAEMFNIKNQLLQNYPNPFHPQQDNITTLRYLLDKKSFVNIKICSLKGEVYQEWKLNEQNPGYYQLEWDGKDRHNRLMDTGIYLMILEINNIMVDTRNIVIKR